MVQLVSELAANTVGYFPSIQLVQLVSELAADTLENFPSTQFVQLDSELAADVVEYFPISHDVHTADPDNGLKVPTSHAVHAATPSGPVDPELQVHTFADEPVTKDHLPVPHDVHTADPDNGL